MIRLKLIICVFLNYYSPFFSKLMPRSFPNEDYHVVLTQGKADKKEGTVVET